MSSRPVRPDGRQQPRRTEQEVKARQARLGATAALLAVAGAAGGAGRGPERAGEPLAGHAVGRLQSGPPPWPAQTEGLAQRVTALGFPPVGDESYHAHALLTVYRDGVQVPVPDDLGFDARGAHASLHTHTPDGVIHLEADDPYPYELAHVFQVWGVPFGADRLGGDVATGDKRVHVYVNGQPAPGRVVLKDGDNVVVAYGTPGSFDPEPSVDALAGA